MIDFLIAFFLGALLLSTSVSAQIIVAKDGSGQFKTINEAIKAANQFGDNIIVKPGEYNESIRIESRKDLNIEAKGEVWIKAKGAEGALTLIDCHGIAIKGFKFSGGISLKDCENSEISGCVFNAANSAISVVNSNTVGIYGNTFTKCTGSIISINDSGQINVINNVMYDNAAKEGIHISKDHKSDIKNNTIAYNQFSPISISQDCNGTKVRNNIIAFNTIGEAAAVVNAASDFTGVKATYNDIFQNKGKSEAAPAYGKIKSENGLTSDPMFTDGAARKFGLKNSSPCIGAGEDGVSQFRGAITGINLGADLLCKGAPIKFEEQFETAVRYRIKKGKGAESIEMLERLLKTYPLNADAWMALGESYLSAKKVDDGIAAFQKCLKIRPNDNLALYDLAWASTLQGKTAEGLAWLEKSLKAGLPAHILETDTGIDGLRNTDGFKKLMKTYDPDQE